jgi:hypothetical protein
VEAAALAIERADAKRIPVEAVIDHPEISDWGEYLARQAVGASLRAVMEEK